MSAERGGDARDAERARRGLRQLEQQPRIDAEHDRRDDGHAQRNRERRASSTGSDPIVSFFRYMKTTMRR